jgi:hypothetical protein
MRQKVSVPMFLLNKKGRKNGNSRSSSMCSPDFKGDTNQPILKECEGNSCVVEESETNLNKSERRYVINSLTNSARARNLKRIF